ncbi:Type I restriction-modification system, restriction subunit R [Acetobacter malorum]|uniref:Type I restriction-modification system, restriction subunit R n=1 Tax=Acetobacter malorum TaxID=178901 RepID=A0A087PQG4_9PROT|nr:DEAD/DEAH box helicase family protein [Acetobacter malorum]KFL89617.1 Type I restriction-modification system, restriction subunit R [Acetobacter malorum]OAG77382.1 Type I restriction-modification system, restriction subunit R [Acetobacter malorum]
MTNLHKEFHLETEICHALAQTGWLYEADTPTQYDAALALVPEDLLAWVKECEPEAWEYLEKTHGAAAGAILCQRVREALNHRGTLTVLRDGLDIIGLPKTLKICQFRPALRMNPHLQHRYAANRLRVVRQVRYSLNNKNAIDLVLCLNGIPVATAELKSNYTQSVQDAVEQYQTDRLPKPPGKPAEPLLSVPGGALVHFAVSNSDVMMCTKLDGAHSIFLPFNKGNAGSAGNPTSSTGPATAYLWEEVWEHDSWLDILGRYIIPKKQKGKITGWIFPRYHQLDATRQLVSTILAEGPGQRYLIQHSAGSGKTNSIAWTAHFLSDLHDSHNHKLFNTVLVVSDRTVLDKQLSETIESFERTKGVVAAISGAGGSKSQDLAQALKDGKKIIICTIQTFPFALEAIRAEAATQNKHFAVIADEAHSSQTGTSATKLKAALSAEEVAQLADGGEISTEDLLALEMASKAAADTNISFIAFTATPKAKTLELFGRLPQPDQPKSKTNKPEPFHLYSMRQAIEEGFILDVLQNYVSWKQAFRLSQKGKALSDEEVEKSEAKKSLMKWVRLHPTNIAARVQIVVEHFRQNVQPLLGGQARAMVVTASRIEAVRWKLAMEKYVKESGYAFGLLAAFSGEVVDPESGPEPFTEANINPLLKGRDLREVFAEDPWRILIVANKFQTGFDQPLLCGMYVDRKLGGIQAVQTLSRLNRCYPGKDITYVVDFANEPQDILSAFQDYYTKAELTDVSDPNCVLNLRHKLDDADLYDQTEVDRVVHVLMQPKASQKQLDGAITPVSSRILNRFKDARKVCLAEPQETPAWKDAKGHMEALLQFKSDLGTYVRMYEFFSQMLNYGNPDYEKLYLFAKLLWPLLKFERDSDTIDLTALQLTHHKMKELGKQKLSLKNQAGDGLQPISEAGSGQPQDKQKATLSAIIETVNDLFGGELTDGDKVAFVAGLETKLAESPKLQEQARANTREQFLNSPDLQDEGFNATIGLMQAHESMSKQMLNDPALLQAVIAAIVGKGNLWERLQLQR